MPGEINRLSRAYERRTSHAAEQRQQSSSIGREELNPAASLSAGHNRKTAYQGSWVLSHSFDSVAIQIGRHVKLLQDIDDARVRELQSKLISEQSRFCSWARDRNISSLTQVESMLNGFPISTQYTVSSLCDVLRTWMQESISKLEKYSSLTAKPLGIRREEELDFIIDGYQLLETLRTVNNGLYTMASSLSNRDRSSYREDIASDHGLSPSPFGSITVVSELPGDIPKNSQVSTELTQPGGETVSDTHADDTELSFDGTSSALRIFFTSCLHALQVVISQVDEKENSRLLYTRLLVWGCGLFHVSMNLDQILDPERQTHREAAMGFRSHVFGTLADIGIILENLLLLFDLNTDPEVQKAITKLQASFGKYEEFSREAMEDELELPQRHESTKVRTFLESSTKQLEGLVDCLFDILPSIDRLRQVWLLNLERQSKIVAASVAKSAFVSNFQLREAETRPVEERTGKRINTPEHSKSSSRLSDELDFVGSIAERSFIRSKAELETQPLKSSNVNPITGSSLQRHIRETSGYQKFLTTEDKKSLQKLLAMDLELATAMRLSVLESQAKSYREKQDDDSILSNLKGWDDEIKRLKDWSEAFDNSLGANPSEAETKKQYSMFEQLAKIGSAFTNAMARNKKGPKVVNAAKQRLESVARTMSKSAGKKFEVNFDFSGTSTSAALSTFREANDNLHKLVELEGDGSILPYPLKISPLREKGLA